MQAKRHESYCLNFCRIEPKVTEIWGINYVNLGLKLLLTDIMYISLLKKSLFLLLWATIPTVLSAQPALPSLGDRISGTVSLEQEYAMGQQFLSSIRRSAPTISDPLLNTYLENVTYKLASRSQL